MARKQPTAEAEPDETTPPEEPATPAAAPKPVMGGERFFAWMRSINVPRQPGWIGGVCAGVAARLGIDPLIVRGIAVVIAVLGGPVFLLYAAAWLLLPDDQNKIHLEELFKGKLESPIAGIGALVLLSILPITQGFWYLGASYWGDPSWGENLGRALWTVAVLVALVWFVVWIARRSSREPGAPTTPLVPTVSPATTDGKPDTIPDSLSTDAAAFVIPEPAAPAADAPAEELADWRERQAAWKAEREEFRKQKNAEAWELNKLRAEEAWARSAEAAEQRRLRRLGNPRVSGAFVAITLGSAAIAGGVATFLASQSTTYEGYEVSVGLAVSVLFLGASLVLSGLLRRRNGFLGFVAVLAVVAMLLTAAMPRDRVLLNLGSNEIPIADGSYAQLWGSVNIGIDKNSEDGAVIDVWQAAGDIGIIVSPGSIAKVEVVQRSGLVQQVGLDGMGSLLDNQRLIDDEWHSSTTVGTTGPTVVIRIWQGRGNISIFDWAPIEEEVQP